MKRINLSISKSGSIERAIKELEKYKQSLHGKSELLVSRLMDVGIEVATNHSGQYAGMITFDKKLSQTVNGCDGVLIATNGQKLIKEWYASKKDALEKKNVRSYAVSPLLLAEFGSGWLANVLGDIPGVGQGTMPGSMGHATDPDGWYWYDESGVKHHSIGETPTYPMHNAAMQMINEVDRIAREVFHG